MPTLRSNGEDRRYLGRAADQRHDDEADKGPCQAERFSGVLHALDGHLAHQANSAVTPSSVGRARPRGQGAPPTYARSAALNTRNACGARSRPST